MAPLTVVRGPQLPGTHAPLLSLRRAKRILAFANWYLFEITMGTPSRCASSTHSEGRLIGNVTVVPARAGELTTTASVKIIGRINYGRGSVCSMKKDATLKQIAAVKPIVSNGNHVETSSNIWRCSGVGPLHNVQMRNSFPRAKVKSGH